MVARLHQRSARGRQLDFELEGELERARTLAFLFRPRLWPPLGSIFFTMRVLPMVSMCGPSWPAGRTQPGTLQHPDSVVVMIFFVSSFLRFLLSSFRASSSSTSKTFASNTASMSHTSFFPRGALAALALFALSSSSLALASSSSFRFFSSAAFLSSSPSDEEEEEDEPRTKSSEFGTTSNSSSSMSMAPASSDPLSEGSSSSADSDLDWTSPSLCFFNFSSFSLSFCAILSFLRILASFFCFFLSLRSFFSCFSFFRFLRRAASPDDSSTAASAPGASGSSEATAFAGAASLGWPNISLAAARTALILPFISSCVSSTERMFIASRTWFWKCTFRSWNPDSSTKTFASVISILRPSTRNSLCVLQTCAGPRSLNSTSPYGAPSFLSIREACISPKLFASILKFSSVASAGRFEMCTVRKR
mmetsp:Transcript_108207/g.304899  ORF Transcript_108207/g.304899 Transcript_108207/m.304899 type:complete len:421 (+) Transcript_108207:350-1612(+)